MSRLPRLEIVVQDTLVSNDFLPFSPTRLVTPDSQFTLPLVVENIDASSETQPLLGGGTRKKPFYRARPLWIVPFAVVAALARGMTLAARVEVFTQLSCQAVHRDQSYVTPGGSPASIPGATFTQPAHSIPHAPSLSHTHSSEDEPTFIHLSTADEDWEEDDPRELPSQQCLSDPVVQQHAAQLQVIMTTTMGLLSALTNGFWGGIGEKYGRTRVLALSTLGLFLTDLIFIVVSSPHPPSSILHSHSTKFLILSPIVEGLLGGWTALQSATSAYVSDCTSPGSKAQIFARFTGVFYTGFSVGPIIGGWLIRHPIVGGDGNDVTSVFYMAIILSGINFLLVVFVFPESLSKERQIQARNRISEGGRQVGYFSGLVRDLVAPMAVFLPSRYVGHDGRRRRDWSLTWIALAFFGYMLSYGVAQIKYLYAGHVYGWAAEQLGYYISFMGGTRALYLLVGLPFIISTFKPKRPVDPPAPATASGEVAGATRPDLRKEIKFDLLLTKLSLFVDIASNTLVMLFPAPPVSHALQISSPLPTDLAQRSQVLFVLASSMNSLGSGVQPAVQSLALCIAQSRTNAPMPSSGKGGAEGMGQLFGALAVLQALGQMIIGPILFGVVYSTTVSTYPKAIFFTAAALLTTSFIFLCCVRTPKGPPIQSQAEQANSETRQGRLSGLGIFFGGNSAKAEGKRRRRESPERGRSRESKDLRRNSYASGHYGTSTADQVNGGPSSTGSSRRGSIHLGAST